MTARLMKYNPAFLSEQELVDGFVVRGRELELLMRVVRENTTESNQHALVIGPRGSGKTTLVLRGVAEVRRDEALSELWQPVVFGEESYLVKSSGEFWLEALFHLGRQTENKGLRRAYEELSTEVDDNRLRERALGKLMDFADYEGKRLLLVVENLNMVLDEQMGDDEAWKLRETLLHEKRVMLLATATRRFEGVDKYERAMFELFRPVELEPLDEEECRNLWEAVTGVKLEGDRIRPIQILTGGSPRLLAIISTFGKGLSFKQLMGDLMRLVDEHTEYFKSHLDGLPAVERSVYLALAELWDPSTAREVAAAAREEVSKTSSLLNRLVKRGVVAVFEERGRTKWYQVAERMYNIYYLMRRRGAPSDRIRAVVQFIITFYGQEEIVDVVRSIAKEACELEGTEQEYHRLTLEQIWLKLSDQEVLEKCREVIPGGYYRTSRSAEGGCGRGPELLRCGEEVRKLITEAGQKRKNKAETEDVERLYRRCVEIEPANAELWLMLGAFLTKCKKFREGEAAYRKGLTIDEDNVCLLTALARLMIKQRNARYEEAYKLLKRASQINANCADAWLGMGIVCQRYLSRFEEAESAYRMAIDRKPKHAGTYAHLGELLHTKLERFDEAEQLYRRAIELDSRMALAWGMLGELLSEVERHDEAEAALKKALEIDPKSVHGWISLGELFYAMGRYDEAEEACRKGLDAQPESIRGWIVFGHMLYGRKKYGEAEKAYKRALSLKEEHACPWVNLGQLLSDESVGRYEEAEAAYLKALEYEREMADTWQALIRVEVRRNGAASRAVAAAREYSRKEGGNWRLLNAIAWAFFKEGRGCYLEEAEDWARRATELEPSDAGVQGTFSCVLAERGKGEEALQHARFFVQGKRLVAKYMQEAMTLFIALAALGHARQVVNVLENSLSVEALEPLVVGLRLYLGEDVKSAVEIMEIGKDVVKRIEEKKRKLAEGV